MISSLFFKNKYDFILRDKQPKKKRKIDLCDNSLNNCVLNNFYFLNTLICYN